MGNNLRTVQFLRSETIASRQAAIDGLTNLLSSTTTTIYDGMVALARYKNEDDAIVTLAGIYAVRDESGQTKKSVTIIDVEGSAADVEALRQEINAKLGSGITSANTVTMQLTALSGNNQSTSAETSVEGAKRYADEKVRASLDALDASSVANENKVVSDVTQTDGKISATTKNITEVKLDGYAEGEDADIAATDTLGQALGKLQGQINAMDKEASSGSGEVVITVTQEDGKVSEVKSKIKDVLLTGYVKGNGVKPIAETDSINSALSKLENSIDAVQSATTVASADNSITVVTATSGTDISVNIKTGDHVLAKDGGNGVYTNIALSSVTPSSTTVREEYSLVGTDGTVLGSNIKIYKDSSLLSVALLHADITANPQVLPTYDKTTNTWTDIPETAQTQANQALCFAYENVSGNTVIAAVPVGSFINEQEFASGVTWDETENKVRGVVDSTSEKDESNNPFLTVGSDGFKISGIKDAIDTKINKLDATVSDGTTAGTVTSDHVQVVIDEVDGKLTAVTVTETNIADKDKTVTEIGSSNNSISATSATTTDGTVKYDIVTDADKIQMSGFSADSTSSLSGILESDSIVTAFEKTNTVITENEEVIANALNDLNGRVDEISGKTLTDVTSANNSITPTITTHTDGTKTVDLATDASKISGLTAVADVDYGRAKLSGVTETDSTRTGIKNLYDSLKSEIQARKDAILARAISGSSAITITETPNGDGFGTTVTLKLDESTDGNGHEKIGTDNALTITDNGLFLSTKWDCGTF